MCKKKEPSVGLILFALMGAGITFAWAAWIVVYAISMVIN
jgi:hypothetical protein